MADILDINNLKQKIDDFSQERNWDQFHNPKNLAMAASVEMAELVEIFQWLTAAEAQNVKDNPAIKENISHELADIMIYLIRLADKVQINLHEAIANKMVLNAKKYPVELAKGSSKKYNEY